MTVELKTGPMQFLFESAGLPWHHWVIIAGAAVTIFLVVELEKAIWRRLQHRRNRSDAGW